MCGENNTVSKILHVLGFANFLQYQRLLMPISYLFYLHNGLNFADFLLFQSLFSLTCLLSKVPTGVIGDYISKKYMLVISYCLFATRVILWIFFKGWIVILVGEILYGLSKSFYQGNVDSYIYEYLKDNSLKEKIVSKYGNLVLYTSLGSATSCLLGALLYKEFGFKFILYVELFFQVFAILLLFLLPKTNLYRVERDIKSCWTQVILGITHLYKNNKLNYKVICSSIYIGITKIFVWSFQPILKMCNSPIVIFGVVNFVNQLLRGVGGKLARIIIYKTRKFLLRIVYFLTMLAFMLLIIAIHCKNYILVVSFIFVVCITIMFYVIYNSYTISSIHFNTEDNIRSTTSSIYTFLGDFSSFLFLLVFKFMYKSLSISNCLILFGIIFAIVLLPFIFKRETLR